MAANEKGVFLYHTSCPFCSSSDAFSVYSTGTGYCYSCGKWSKLDDIEELKPTMKKSKNIPMVIGEPTSLSKRKISESICKQYSYEVGKDNFGETVQIATYFNKSRQKIAQKLKYADKRFIWTGDAKASTLFGQQLWATGGKKITITEGEIDCLSVAEAFDGKFPVVSIENGAPSAYKSVVDNIEFLNSFEEIYLWFDNDEVGREALEKCVPLFPQGKVKIIQHSTYKDANEVLKNEGKAGIVKCFYNAKEYRPDGFCTPKELLEDALKPIEYGLPWIYQKLTDISYGRHYGEIVALGAGVAAGKTDFLMQQIAFDIKEGRKVATFMLEQSKTETLLRVCSKLDAKFYYLPDTEYDKDTLKDTILGTEGKLFIYDNFGRIDWETIKSKIRSASITYDIKLFYIDNLTALNAHADDERRNLDALMEEVASLAKELNIWILLVSHLNPPKKGASHEAGGRVEQSQFTGSRAIMRWCQFMLGIERNTLADTKVERQKGLIRCIKDRLSGKGTGQTIPFIYDDDTGLCYASEEDFVLEVDNDEENNDF